MAITYNIPPYKLATAGAGPVHIFNNLQDMVDHPRGELSTRLRDLVRTSGFQGLVWVHHGHTRDSLRALFPGALWKSGRAGFYLYLIAHAGLGPATLSKQTY